MADHWGRHPSSAQHIARCLPRGIDVLWVETTGLITPRLDGETVRVGLQHLVRRLTRSASAAPDDTGRVRVIAPWTLPFWRRPWQQRWNARTLARRIEAWSPASGGERVLVTTLPLAAPVVDQLGFDRVVYYCVDDFTAWPGADRGSLASMERRLIDHTDVFIAASRVLQRRLAAMGCCAHHLPHGVDPELWGPHSATQRDNSIEADLRQLPRPILLYFGLVDRRTDAQWVRVAQESTGGTVLLVGPRRSPDPDLLRLPGVRLADAVPTRALPSYAAACDALILPYADTPVTQASQPLKLLEYLSTDRPVVMSSLPACEEWADAADIANDPREFGELIVRRLREGVPPRQLAARARARSRTWQQVTNRFVELIAPLDSARIRVAC